MKHHCFGGGATGGANVSVWGAIVPLAPPRTTTATYTYLMGAGGGGGGHNIFLFEWSHVCFRIIRNCAHFLVCFASCIGLVCQNRSV